MTFTILLVVIAVGVGGYAVWRGLRHAEVVGPEHERPLEAKADVLAARMEHIADNLVEQANLLRDNAAEARSTLREEKT